MKFDIEFKYTEKDVIPPRCRKPRDIMHEDGRAELVIAELSGEDAPVAIIEQTSVYRKGVSVPVEQRYRWYDNQLWLPWWPAVGEGEVTLDDPHYIPYMAKDYIGWGHRTIEEARSTLDHFAANHVFIDGVAHQPATEPMLSVNTYHYDGRHGAYVGVTNNSRNDPKSSLYRADQYALAKTEVDRIRARMREAYGAAGPDEGDSADDRRLTVLMPEVLRRDPQVEAVAEEAAAHAVKIAKAVLGAAGQIEQAIKSLDKAAELIGDPEEFGPSKAALEVVHTRLMASSRIPPIKEDV